MLSPAVAGV